jgi:hypothetical protein
VELRKKKIQKDLVELRRPIDKYYLASVLSSFVRITKLEGSVLSHGCCYRIIVIMPCQIRCFGKSLRHGTAYTRRVMITEGEGWLNRRNIFLSESSWGNPSSRGGKQFQTVMLSRYVPTFLIYVCVLLVGSDVE